MKKIIALLCMFLPLSVCFASDGKPNQGSFSNFQATSSSKKTYLLAAYLDNDLKAVLANPKDPNAQADLYEKLIKVRNGKAVEGVGEKDPETSLTLVANLIFITSPKDNLRERSFVRQGVLLLSHPWFC